jgi:uncharacterized OB-fold protein
LEQELKSNTVKCEKCGYIQHISHRRCLNCKHNKFKIINPSGKCKLLTYTILTAPPAEFRNKPSYALGVVEFENGVRALGQLTTEQNLKTGMELKPVYAKICDDLDGKEIYKYIFSPI